MAHKSVADIDKNLKVQSSIDKEDVVFLDAREDPFQIYGLYDYKNQPQFIRMPKEMCIRDRPHRQELLQSAKRAVYIPSKRRSQLKEVLM